MENNNNEELKEGTLENNAEQTEKSEIAEPTSEVVKNQEEKTFEAVDFSNFKKEELLAYFKSIVKEYNTTVIKDTVENIKNCFYKIHNNEVNEKRNKFIEEGGDAKDFLYEDSIEKEFTALYKSYKEQKAELAEKAEKEKIANLKKRQEIIEKIKDLVNKEESFDQTFQEFRALQEEWKAIGMVPQAESKNIWETYHHNVSLFYDYVKINKDLRDLDLKKNLEAKIALCEKAEELILNESVVKAFAELQDLHNQWREIGPIPNDKKDEIWERFKNATTQVNKKHQDYFLAKKEQEKKNLEAKELICEKIEEITKINPSSTKEWLEKSDEIMEFQKVWKTIGFAPQKNNTEIYERFQKLCNDFFSAKREYFENIKDVEGQNKQKKIDLCLQAERLADSTDWKQTTNDLIKLQKDWKEIGSVSRKDSEKLWKRFRSACDKFFNAKEAYFASFEIEQKENLQKKLDIIAQIENLELSDNQEANLSALKKLQKDWTEIGFVPLKEKEEIQNKYRDAIGKKFEQLSIDGEKKKELEFKVKLDNLKQDQGSDKLSSERSKIQNKLKTIQNDIVTLENNIGFFANSKNANSLKAEVERKIEKYKKEIEVLNKQLRMLNELEENL